MKKKLAVVMTTLLAIAMLGGCGTKENGADQATTQEETGVEVEKADLKDIKVEDYVTLGDYKGLELTVSAKRDYTQEEIDQEVLAAYLPYVSLEAGGVKDRAAEDGDTVNIDYAGTLDGVAFDGGTATNQQLGLGTGKFIDGFEAGLVGVMPGETVDLNLSFPEGYKNNPDLAGKEVVFTVTVNFIYPSEKSQMVDEVVASMGSEYFTTVQEIIDYCKSALAIVAERTYVSNKQSVALEALMQNCTVSEAPQELVNRYYDSIYNSLSVEAAQYYVDVETYCSYFFQTDAATYVTTYAQQYAQWAMVVQAIANAEDLNISDEELEVLLQDAIEKKQIEVETNRSQEDQEALREYFMFEKVLNFILENGVVTEA